MTVRITRGQALMTARITRRQALTELIAAGAFLAAGCGSGPGGPGSGPTGSTIAATWSDPAGTGVLEPGQGERLLARTELGPARATTRTLARLAHLTDAHVLDASSPARVPFLDRVGAPFQSTFRPQETLTTQVLAGAVRVIRALRPDAVIEGGDLTDNDQRNELAWALTVMAGGVIRPGSGSGRYVGVQSAANPDPFYYRPEIDAPRHPRLLREAVRAFTARGIGTPWHPVLGDHDILVAGEIAPTAQTQTLALGDEALWELPAGLQLPNRGELVPGSSPDGPPKPELVDKFLAQALAGPKVRVPADPRRAEMDAAEVVERLRRAGGKPLLTSHSPGLSGRLDYHADVGAELRLIVIDLTRRGGGSGGLVGPDQPAWLEAELAAAGQRYVIAVSHQPLATSEGGDRLLALLDRDPRVIAALSGHTHRNLIVPRPTPAGGYWLISTASLIDYPQQARALEIVSTAGGGVAVHTWMLDHVFPGKLGAVSRQLAYLDAQGGRPKGFAGTRRDRNVTLYRAST
jgi:3',5'-cyclic AMP phosphodiesterase CpdA